MTAGRRIGQRHCISLVAVLVVGLAALMFSGAASAAPRVHVFEESFGAAAQPTFTAPEGLAVDQSNGDLLAIDAAEGTVSRYSSNGTAAAFEALGSNVIDGKGAGDGTPQEGLSFGSGREVQIAVDNSGGATDGDIYVTQAGSSLIDIFASTGEYLGQLTESSEGGLGEVCGVAVDPSGNVYVGDYTAVQVHKFVPSGDFPQNGDNSANFPVLTNLCIVAAGAGPSAGFVFPLYYGPGGVSKLDAATGVVQYTFAEGMGESNNTVETVDPANGNLLVASGSEVTEYDVSGSTGAVAVSTLKAGGTVDGLAVDEESGRVYVAVEESPQIEVFGPPVPLPSVAITPASDLIGGRATLNATVNPEGLTVTECEFEYGLVGSPTYTSSAPCDALPPTDSEPHSVSAAISGLTPNGVRYRFRVSARSESGLSQSGEGTFQTASTARTEPATQLANEGATLNGTVAPEGEPLTACEFEYGPTAAYGSSAPCTPPASSIPADSALHSVESQIGGLQRNTIYHFRLVMHGGGGLDVGEDLTFTTHGLPRVGEEFASGIGTEGATINANVDPAGHATAYHFEWGTSSAYGNRTPASGETSLTSETEPADASVGISGLRPGTVYHFRVVVRSPCEGPSPAGECVVDGPDQEFVTLNVAGFPDERAAELVSPADAGPLAVVGDVSNVVRPQIIYQVDPSGDGALFDLAPGTQVTTAGGEVIYGARRGVAGWDYSQVSPPALDGANRNNSNIPGVVLYSSSALDCQVVASNSVLTPDTPLGTLEEGSANLFRRGPGGQFTLLTPIVPTNPQIESGSGNLSFLVVGASPDCSRIYFQTAYRYPGAVAREGESIHGHGSDELYEWDEASAPHLRHVGFVPGESDEVPVTAEAGLERNFVGAVSSDGRTVIFTALRKRAGAVAGAPEDGKLAVFARIDGAETVDVSESETSTPDLGASFQDASADGGRIFFLANYGLTTHSSSGRAICEPGSGIPDGEGCDLYEFDLAKGEDGEPALTDLSPDLRDPEGAGVAGVLGTSRDGSFVYLAAAGQLVEGEGRTFAENSEDASYNIYLHHAGRLSYVGTLGRTEAENMLTSIGKTGAESAALSLLSRVSPDGRHLLFESSLPLTGYDSDGVREAFIYGAETEGLQCVSCRRDGQPPVKRTLVELERPLGTGSPKQNRAHLPTTLSADGQFVFFESPDPLAPGAVPGDVNIYEWRGGSVYLLATGTPSNTLTSGIVQLPGVEFAGASEDGRDVFITTPERLAPQDSNERRDLYDLRTGGGFAPPAEPPAPCDPLGEGACQGGPAPPPSATAPVTPGFFGPSDPVPTKHRKHRKKKHKKHHGRSHSASSAKKPGHNNGKARHGQRGHGNSHGPKGGRG